MTGPAQDATVAGLFHAGNTCPYCQEGVAAGQWIVACPSCGAIHHDTCYSHKGGCSSYNCDRAVRMENPERPPDIVLTSGEVADAVLTAPRSPRSSEGPSRTAAAYLPPTPTRQSRLAVAAAVCAAVSLVGIMGAATGNMPVVVLAVATAFASIATGVIALLRIGDPGKRLSGLWLAGGSVLAAVVLVVSYFVLLDAHLNRARGRAGVNLQFQGSPPSEERLSQMAEPLARAMRANVVVRHSGAGVLEAQSYASGIVLKSANGRVYVLTNKHAVGEGKGGRTVLLFHTGESSEASLEWSAPEGVDLVILACRATTLEHYPALVVAEDVLAAGTSVFAIGNPIGLSWTYTEGSISGLRHVEGGPHGVDLYQTQTPINTGNSGGGLYARDGRLVGINTLTQDKQVSEGLSFSISTVTFLRLLSAGERMRWLGAAGGTP